MTGLTQTLRDLEKLKGELIPNGSGKASEMLKGLTLACRAEVGLEYDKAKATPQLYEGIEGTTVDSIIDGNEATIFVKGDRVMFHEFGSGINLNNGSDSDYAAAQGYFPASLSMQGSQWLLPPRSIQFKGWWPVPHKRMWTQGNPPIDALYHTFQHLVTEYFPNITRRIFR